MFHDLREYIEALEKLGLVKRIKAEVDWNLEMGAVTRLVCERREAAPLFENVRGYPGHRVLGVVMGPSRPALHARVAVALGADPDTHPLRLIELVREQIGRARPPVEVDRDSAPCKEIVVPADQIDLLSLPVPWIKSVDGGRYIGTWDIVVTRHPDTGWLNWGVYRCMVVDGRSLAILLHPSGQHGGAILRRYQELDKPMPVALVIGADPYSQLAAVTPFDAGFSECDAAGGFRGEPAPVVRCETSDLMVPASAEIVIEAEILPGVRVPEGPFGEYTGHVVHRGMSPLARVTAITHRRDPIFTMANMGKPWDDASTPLSILSSALIKDRLERSGIPVTAVYRPAPTTAVIVSARTRPGLAMDMFTNLFSGHRILHGTGLILVDDDIDITDYQDVWWALTTRMHPERIRVVRGVPLTNPLVPHLPPHERIGRETSLWILDATVPTDWSPEYRDEHAKVADFDRAWTADIRERVLSRWTDYGFDT